MSQLVISIDNIYNREYKYLVGVVDRCYDICHATYSSANRYYITLEGTQLPDKVLYACEEILLTGFKYYEFWESLGRYILTPLDKCILYASLDFDTQLERDTAIKTIRERDEIHLDAIYHFSFLPLRKNWEWLIGLVKEFYQGGASEEDKYDLLSFMISLNLKKPSQKRARYYVGNENSDMTIQRVFYYLEKWREGEYIEDRVKKILNTVFE